MRYRAKLASLLVSKCLKVWLVRLLGIFVRNKCRVKPSLLEILSGDCEVSGAAKYDFLSTVWDTICAILERQ